MKTENKPRRVTISWTFGKKFYDHTYLYKSEINELNLGTYGYVCKVEKISTQEQFALKKSYSKRDETDEVLNSVELKGIRALFELSISNAVCKYVVKYEDFFFDYFNYFYLVTEYCEDGNLASQIKSKLDKQESFDLKTLIRWTKEIVLGLDFLHSHSIIHRDIKPANILFKNGHIKLGNLGEPRNIKELVVGAQNSIWAYMSPEMLTKNNDEINEKTDIWSFGVTLFELINLKRPYHTEDINEQWAILHEPIPDLNANMPKYLKQLIHKMLHKDPIKRIDLNEVRASLKNSNFLQAEEFFKTNEYSKSIEYLNRSLEQKKGSEPEAYYIKGRCLLMLNEKEEAIECWKKAIEHKHIGANIYMGFLSTNKTESKQFFENALKLNTNPTVPRDVLRKEISLEALTSLDNYDDFVPLEKYYANIMYNKAAHLYEIGDFTGALNRYRIAIELNPTNANSFNNIGCTLIKIGDFKNAVFWYDKAIEINSNYASAYDNKGLSLESMGKHVQAISCYEKAIQINPNVSDFYLKKANSLHSLARYEEAVECYSKAIQLNANDSFAFSNKGNSLVGLQRYAEAEECYNKAIELNPYDSSAICNKGNYFYKMKCYVHALECYDLAIQLNPNDVASLNNKGRCLHNLKNYDEAMSFFDKAILLSPRYAAALNNRGRCCQAMKKFDEAIDCYNKAIRLNGKFVECINNKASCLHEMRDFDGALYCSNRVLQLSPNNVIALENKMNSLSKLRDFKGALYYLYKTIDIKATNYFLLNISTRLFIKNK